MTVYYVFYVMWQL